MEYRYSDITGTVIAAALEVHKEMGNGFQEVIYQRALEVEMNLRGWHLHGNQLINVCHDKSAYYIPSHANLG